MRRFGVAGVAVLVVGLVGVMPAFATGAGWAIQPTPNPSGSTSSLLFGVSCPSAMACTDVGTYTNAAGIDVTVAERWDGTNWSIEPTPNPTSATGSFLFGVSCSSSAACTAVGYSADTFGDWSNLAERWDGTSWSIQPIPSPSGLDKLFGVSCTSATVCTAVGTSQNAAGLEVTLAERWNGTRWKVQPTPNPSGATFSELLGVSCTSASACTAVGIYIDGAGVTVTLAERWNGTAWTIQPTPNPTPTRFAGLAGVSCTSAIACTAVGAYTNSAGREVTLAELWNGTTWTLQPTPNPAGGKFVNLSGVSCTSASACTGVGSYFNRAHNQVTLAEHWNGTSWAIQPTLNPNGASRIQLAGVSCMSATVCIAAGNYRESGGIDLTLVERSS